MILVGRNLSPFVRRSAIVLKTLGLDFESKGLSTADDGGEIMQINPVGRVPSLILEDGETIVDSQAIIDHALEVGDPDNRLVAPSGPDRRAVLRISAIAQGAMEKAVASSYERTRRPKDKVYKGWVEQVDAQNASALASLDAMAKAGGDWMHGDHMTLADINAAVAYDFVSIAEPYLVKDDAFPALAALSQRCNALPAFSETQWKG